jgi:PIN domain nuclease of toxin-antitoxin system
MTVLLDTCAVLWLGNGDTIAPEAVARLNRNHADNTPVLASPFSAWEIGNLVSLNRIRLSQPPDKWFETFRQKGNVGLAPLTPDVLVAASFLPEIRHKDPADRILIATARAEGLTILTRDQKILDYAEQGHVNALKC